MEKFEVFIHKRKSCMGYVYLLYEILLYAYIDYVCMQTSGCFSINVVAKKPRNKKTGWDYKFFRIFNFFRASIPVELLITI